MRDFFSFFKKLVGKGLKLQLIEDFPELLLIGVGEEESLKVERDRHIGFDGGQGFRHAYVVDMLLHLFLHGTLEQVGMGKKLFHRSKLIDELHGGLLPHSGTAGEVVGSVAHEGEQVDHL